VKCDGMALQYASEALRADKEVVMTAVVKNCLALQYASEALKADKEVVMQVVEFYGSALQYASEALRADKEVVMKAVNNGLALQYASEALKADKEVVMKAVKCDGMALQYASEALRADKEVVMKVVEKAISGVSGPQEQEYIDPKAFWPLQHVSSRFKEDKECMKAVVEVWGLALADASPAIRNDKEVVALAVAQNVWSFAYTGKAVVLAVVSLVGEALEFASEALRADKEVVLAAVRQSEKALAHATIEEASKEALETQLANELAGFLDVSPDIAAKVVASGLGSCEAICALPRPELIKKLTPHGLKAKDILQVSKAAAAFKPEPEPEPAPAPEQEDPLKIQLRNDLAPDLFSLLEERGVLLEAGEAVRDAGLDVETISELGVDELIAFGIPSEAAAKLVSTMDVS